MALLLPRSNGLLSGPAKHNCNDQSVQYIPMRYDILWRATGLSALFVFTFTGVPEIFACVANTAKSTDIRTAPPDVVLASYKYSTTARLLRAVAWLLSATIMIAALCEPDEVFVDNASGDALLARVVSSFGFILGALYP